MAPDLTAIVVTYRSAAHVGACLQALAGGAGALRVERVVVDNASGDATTDIVRQAAPGARLILNDANRGFAVAVNQAAREARGRYLLLLNPDARPLPGCLTRLVAEMDAVPQVALAGAQLLDPDGTPQPSAWPEPGLLTLAYDAFLLRNVMPRSRLRLVTPPGEAPMDVECLSGACLLVRRTAFEALGGLDERFFIYYEDTDLARRARAAGHRVRLVPQARAVHLLGGSSFQDRREFRRRFHESRRLYLAKHHPGPRGAALQALHWGGFAVRAGLDRLRGLV
jgi:GT2 family glycosyltransferase